MQPNETLEQAVQRLTTSVTEIHGGWAEVKPLPALIKSIQDQHSNLVEQLDDLRHRLLVPTTQPRPYGGVTDPCALELASHFILRYEKSGHLEALSSAPSECEKLAGSARSRLGLTTRAALTTANIPLPTQYGNELRALISEFGVARRYMSHYPIGMGTAKPVRMGARPAFTSIVMSAAFTEKVPTFTLASLESHKLGGIVRVPRELDEQSILPLGHFLARYAATEFARAEDTWAFLADGSAEFENIKGICQYCGENGYALDLPAGKTKPSDVTLPDIRGVRTKVNKAALNGRISAYYLDSTWEAKLPSLNTEAEPHVYIRRPDGSAVLDGYPIIWTDVLQPYDTIDAAGKPIAAFGALSYWWFGEHGTPRIDTSDQVYFSNDQLAVRFIEEIDFDYCAGDAVAILRTAAA